MNILITGSAGFIGFHTSLKLIEKTKAKTLGVIIFLELAFLNGRSKLKNKLISLYSVST